MATIMEEVMWTLTEAAADRMVENGLLVKCEGKHTEDVLERDRPIYHRACDAPSWFGFSTMDQAIRSAEAHVEKEVLGMKVKTDPEMEPGTLRMLDGQGLVLREIVFDPTMNPEPGGPGSFTVVKETPDAATS